MAVTLLGFRQERLVNVISTGLECVGGCCHVQAPYTVGHIIREATRFVSVRFQATYPVAQCERIVFPQALYVAYLEAARLCYTQRAADRYQLSIRKYITIGEVCFPLCGDRDVAGSAVIEEDASGTQQAPGLLEVCRQQGFSYVLKHAHTDDFIERVGLSDIAVIAHFHPAFLRQSSLADTLLCQSGLRLTERNAIRLYPIMLRCIDRQASPTAADIQQTLTGAQAQLAANILELAFLGCVYIVARRGEVGAGVDHARIQPAGIKIIGAVVVIGDGLSISLFRVALTAQLCCCISRARLACVWQAQKAFPKAQLSPASIHELIPEWKNRFDISFDIKVIVDICLPQGQIAGWQEHFPQRSWMLQVNGKACRPA